MKECAIVHETLFSIFFVLLEIYGSKNYYNKDCTNRWSIGRKVGRYCIHFCPWSFCCIYKYSVLIHLCTAYVYQLGMEGDIHPRGISKSPITPPHLAGKLRILYWTSPLGHDVTESGFKPCLLGLTVSVITTNRASNPGGIWKGIFEYRHYLIILQSFHKLFTCSYQWWVSSVMFIIFKVHNRPGTVKLFQNLWVIASCMSKTSASQLAFKATEFEEKFNLLKSSDTSECFPDLCFYANTKIWFFVNAFIKGMRRCYKYSVVSNAVKSVMFSNTSFCITTASCGANR